MWQTIATFKDNLSQIASEVLDTAEELELEIAASQAAAEVRDHVYENDLPSPSSSHSRSPARSASPSATPSRSPSVARSPRTPFAAWKEPLSRAMSNGSVLREQDTDQGEHGDEQKEQGQQHQEEQQQQVESETEQRQQQSSASADLRMNGTGDLARSAADGNKSSVDGRSAVRAESNLLRAERQKVETLSEQLKAQALRSVELQQQLEAVSTERDNAVRDLKRLKQHLLDKDLADSQKMDEDSEQISLLQEQASASQARVLQLEQALGKARDEHAHIVQANALTLQQVTGERDSLQLQVQRCTAALNSKDTELSNLQSALGQYYADLEARDRLQHDLSFARDQILHLSDRLNHSESQLEAASAQRDSALEQLSALETKLMHDQGNLHKLEEEVVRLRRALEQSITRLNRMSTDSDYSVDRRIVIKLLVTYFQRNHSREVLDLMVRMLGFSEEEKRQVGFAQQSASRGGIVKGVLGRPARFVGGLLGTGGSPATPSPASPSTKDSSFADLWIDFLLKESEERERREKAAIADGNGENLQSKEEDEFVPVAYR